MKEDNKQTLALLHGAGAQQHVIKETTKKQISAKMLHKLVKEDFLRLGADEDSAERMFKMLHIPEKNSNVKPYRRIAEKIEILKVAKEQFNLMRIVLSYGTFKIKNDKLNDFVDLDKGFTASYILCHATDATIEAINEADLKLKELEAMMIMPKSNGKYSFLLYCIPIGGFCIVTCIYMSRFWR